MDEFHDEPAGGPVIGEAETCRRYVEPLLDGAGWDLDPHSYTEQVTFTDGRIIVIGSKVRRRPGRRADYLLRLTRDFPIAVVEAKAAYRPIAPAARRSPSSSSTAPTRAPFSTRCSRST